MDRTRKVLLTVLVIGILGTLAGFGTFSAFSSTTENRDNAFQAGTVYLEDNDAGTSMYQVSNAAPLDQVQRCIRITYLGSLPADVRLYTASSINPLGDHIDLVVEKGTMPAGTAFPGCTGFSSEATLFTGTLSGFAASHGDYATGLPAYPGAGTSWVQNDTLVYRFTLTLRDDNAANGQGAGPLSTGPHTYTWEARDQ
ncbi:MAG TPA: TasA family protein [Actinomycetota bacterium]|nr:TasA family protein [Actinomycetota bacterium]